MSLFGFWARLKSIAGNQSPPVLTIAGSANALAISNVCNSFYVTCANASSIATIGANQMVMAGRIIHFEGAVDSASGVTFTNNAGTTTKGEMDLGTIDALVDMTDVLCLKQRDDGVWVQQYRTNN